jgi:vacuolar protein sorting-associated protein 13A/C
MQLHQSGRDPIQFMTSKESSEQAKDLLTVKYVRAQRESPEFTTLFEGIDQNVNVEISTFVFHAAPEPMLSLYDFIMTTFTTPNAEQVAQQSGSQGDTNTAQVATPPPDLDSKIRVLVKLDRVQCGCWFEFDEIAFSALQQ